MPIPQPRTKDAPITDLDGEPAPVEAVSDGFATSGSLTVSVTNNYDEACEVQLEAARLAPKAYLLELEPPKRVPAGGTVTFDGDDLGSERTYYRAAVRFDTAPSQAGDVTVTYEQLDSRRDVVVPTGAAEL